ncbi:MAG TPA: hypothetical protein VFS20_27545 [Longimicrobium sp.]|nr:hypothetical protein [Longimicrobium sp.]
MPPPVYPHISPNIAQARFGGRVLAACAALLVLAACGGGDGPVTPPPPNPLVVTATGRMERGSTITVTVTADGQPASGYALSAQPADAIEVVSPGLVKLVRTGAVTLTATAGTRTGKTDLTVAVPPVVVFDRYVNNNRDIWRVDLDGQNLTQLTTDTGEDQDPTVAQGKVVWVSFRAGRAELYSRTLAAGGTDTRITNTVVDESVPAFSPDGARLGFAQVAGGVTKVFTSNADGTGAVRATSNNFGFSGAIETAPTFAPGSKLAFVATANGSADIFEVVGAAAPTLLAGGNMAEVEPAWSANGNTLAFVSNRTGSTEIFLLNVGTGAVTQLTSGAGTKSQPAWTPDGRVVYLETQNNGATLLRWVDPAQPATVTTINTGPGTVEHPAVAPGS